MNPLGLTDREVLIVWAWATGRDAAWLARFTGRTLYAIREDERRVLRKLRVRGKTHATATVFRAIIGSEQRGAEEIPKRPGISFKRLAEGARRAVLDGVDPELALSYVIWPPKSLERYAA